MNALPTEFSGWTRQRFFGVVGIIFVVQAALILVFAESKHEPASLDAPPIHFHLLEAPLNADQLTSRFFAIDPTVFPLPGPHGFSEGAWLRLPAQQFDLPGDAEMPAWLPLDETRLGTNFALVEQARSPLPFGLDDTDDAELEPWPVTLLPESIRAQSAFEIQGELSARRLSAPEELRTWTNAQLLSNSIVQIAVDSEGQVVAAQLLARSGLTDADTNALDNARHLRFRPISSSAPVWGNAIFEWQTAEPTNLVTSGLTEKP